MNCHTPNTPGASIKLMLQKLSNTEKKSLFFPCLHILFNSSDPLILSSLLSSLPLHSYVFISVCTHTRTSTRFEPYDAVLTVFLFYSNPLIPPMFLTLRDSIAPLRQCHSNCLRGREEESAAGSHSWEGAGDKRGGRALSAFPLCPGLVPAGCNKDWEVRVKSAEVQGTYSDWTLQYFYFFCTLGAPQRCVAASQLCSAFHRCSLRCRCSPVTSLWAIRLDKFLLQTGDKLHV